LRLSATSTPGPSVLDLAGRLSRARVWGSVLGLLATGKGVLGRPSRPSNAKRIFDHLTGSLLSEFVSGFLQPCQHIFGCILGLIFRYRDDPQPYGIGDDLLRVRCGHGRGLAERIVLHLGPPMTVRGIIRLIDKRSA